MLSTGWGPVVAIPGSSVLAAKLRSCCWCSDADTLVSDIIGNADLDVGKISLDLCFDNVLHESKCRVVKSVLSHRMYLAQGGYLHPTFSLKLAVPTVHHSKDAFPQTLLHLPN